MPKVQSKFCLAKQWTVNSKDRGKDTDRQTDRQTKDIQWYDPKQYIILCTLDFKGIFVKIYEMSGIHMEIRWSFILQTCSRPDAVFEYWLLWSSWNFISIRG